MTEGKLEEAGCSFCYARPTVTLVTRPGVRGLGGSFHHSCCRIPGDFLRLFGILYISMSYVQGFMCLILKLVIPINLKRTYTFLGPPTPRVEKPASTQAVHGNYLDYWKRLCSKTYAILFHLIFG